MASQVHGRQQTKPPLSPRKVSLWQTEVEAAINRQGVQQRFPIRNLDKEPMVDREVLSSRFVSQQAGHTVKQEQLPPNRVQRRWQPGDRRLRGNPVLRDQMQLPLWVAGCSVPLPDQPNRTDRTL